MTEIVRRGDIDQSQIPFYQDVEWIVCNDGHTIRHVAGEKQAKKLLEGPGSHYGVIVKKTGIYFRTGPDNELELN